MSIEARQPVVSKSRCETTTGRDNEFLWTEKFIVPPASFTAYAWCPQPNDRPAGAGLG